MEDVPPTYSNIQDTPAPIRQDKRFNLKLSSGSMSMQSTSPIDHRFPKEFGFYHASGSFSDLMIAQHADDKMLWYISTHNSFSSQPSIILHSVPNASAPPLATADFHSFSNKVDISLFIQHGIQMSNLKKASSFGSGVVFQARVAQTNTMEWFEWKNSRSNEVGLLRGRSQGMKLTRKSNGQVVAVWARPNITNKKRGKMAFLADRAALGEEFELMAVITILAIMEKARRQNSGATAAGGAGAAAAVC